MSARFMIKFEKPVAWDWNELRDELKAELNREGEIQQRMLDKTTRTWRGVKPTFERKIIRTSNVLMVSVYPGGSEEGKAKWSRINYGTALRRIYPRSSSPLRFRVPFSPKTTPRTFGSKAGSRGETWVSHKQVLHKIEPRNWLDEIVKRRQDQFHKNMEKAMDKGIVKADP